MMLEDLYRLLRSGHIQSQGVVDTINQPLVVLDASLTVNSANPAFFTKFNVEREDTLGTNLAKLGNGQWDVPELTHLLREVIPRSAAVIGYEVTHDFPSIGMRTMLITARRLVHPDNNSLYILVVFEDVTGRRQEDTGRDLIVAEIEHRLKNYLALVMALARQVPADGEGPASYRDALVSRLQVLTAAEAGLFSQSGNDLASLMALVLAPYGEKVRLVEGPRVRMNRLQVRALSMVLHELATNSVQYGALSSGNGKVLVAWSIGDGEHRPLTLDWREEGGPAASSPEQDGFGTKLINASVGMDLCGTIDMRYEPDGLKVRIEAPLDAP
jgi:two-component sensor histidine kinase